jgi:hypothetical protein
MRYYRDDKKSAKYKNFDIEKVNEERKIKNMPISHMRRTVDCMNEIQKCKNYSQLKHQIEAELKGNITKTADDKKKDRYNDTVEQRRRANGFQPPVNREEQRLTEIVRQSIRNQSSEVKKMVQSMDPVSYNRIFAKLMHEQQRKSLLRMKYQPNQLKLNRATQAIHLAETAGFVDEEARKIAMVHLHGKVSEP